MRSARDLTLFGKVMIIKTLSLSQLIYSASNLVVPAGIEGTVKTKWFNFFLEKQERTNKKIRTLPRYQQSWFTHD